MKNDGSAAGISRQECEKKAAAPLIGIAIPAYRAAETLEETLRSCQAQTWTNWVAFVTVEGTDAVREMQIADKLADPRIHIECNGRQLGQTANFNRAMMRCYSAGSAWVKLMSADDVLYPDALARILEVGSSSDECGLVYGYFNDIDEHGKIIGLQQIEHIQSRVMDRDQFLRLVLPQFRNPVGGPSSVAIRTDAMERCGIFDDFVYTGDRDYWFRIISKYKVGIVGERPILSYRRHSNSVSGRLYLTPIRLAEDADIGRRIASRNAPWSEIWWLGQRLTATAVAANFVSCLAMLKRGDVKTSLSCLALSLRRLSLISAPFALGSFIAMMSRYLFTGHAGSGSEIDPVVPAESQHRITS